MGMNYAVQLFKADFHSLKNERAVGNYPISEKSNENFFYFPYRCIGKGVYTYVIGKVLNFQERAFDFMVYRYCE